MFIRLRGVQFSRLRPGLYLVLFCSADLVAIVIQGWIFSLPCLYKSRLTIKTGFEAIGGAMAAIALGNGEASETGTHVMVRCSCPQCVTPKTKRRYYKRWRESWHSSLRWSSSPFSHGSTSRASAASHDKEQEEPVDSQSCWRLG